ncbi:glycosyl transferase family 2 [Micromonospora echinospora]|uniref:Hyaluronan synthase n=1 Tax=Micromonospora echinospora TaxID=1877 RepID=A0A1C4VAS3_MICEC|nr:glycosyltransferase family 2 protein [Micromonospora echinospora]OZV83201.1 glycosyl transferase family 2 [Micromonospora echinospora]SCE80911.1 hyaluronan synthase [Micromonospora echinospora]
MLAFLLQVNSWLNKGQLYLFALFMIMIWALWLMRVVLASSYKPWTAPYATTTSVIIPVVDEPEELFRSVLDRILEQRPTEVIVVINGPRNATLEKICAEVGVRWAWTEIAGKRNALQVGVGMATGDIAVLVDSDTIWTRGTLPELIKPFRDPRVGGVTTRQRILNPERTVLTRWADWLENVRNEYSMPAMSVLGTVGCLPGRTIAFRRFILVRCMERFMSERFLGVFLEVSDDRTLTNYTLQAGFRTVFQSTSLVYTDAPLELRKLVKQQYRWARGSQYNTLRMFGWMVRRAPVLAVFYAADILVPFVLVGSYFAWAYSLLVGDTVNVYDELRLPGSLVGWQLVLTILGLSAMMTALSLMIRFARHFAFRPRDLAYLPAFMMINTFVLMPVRVLGFFRLAHNAGWGTRAGGFQGERQRNPLVLVPYLLGGAMLVTSVMIGV